MSEKEPIKIRLSTVILLFIIFALVLALIFTYLHFTALLNIEKDNINTNNAVNNTSTTQTVNSTELDIESDEIQKLYKYIMKINTNQETLVYRNEKVTEKDLNNQLKLITIFENVDEDDISSVKTLKDENMYDVEHTYYTKETIEDVAKKVFGNDVSITHESCEAFFASARDFKNGIYDCYQYEGGGGTLWEGSPYKLISAEQIDNEIYIYDKYVHLVENYTDGDGFTETLNIYESSDKTVSLAENVDLPDNTLYINDMITNIETFLGKEVLTFKHTFKKSENGSYYWYSTEPVR